MRREARWTCRHEAGSAQTVFAAIYGMIAATRHRFDAPRFLQLTSLHYAISRHRPRSGGRGDAADWAVNRWAGALAQTDSLGRTAPERRKHAADLRTPALALFFRESRVRFAIRQDRRCVRTADHSFHRARQDRAQQTGYR